MTDALSEIRRPIESSEHAEIWTSATFDRLNFGHVALRETSSVLSSAASRGTLMPNNDERGRQHFNVKTLLRSPSSISKICQSSTMLSSELENMHAPLESIVRKTSSLEDVIIEELCFYMTIMHSPHAWLDSRAVLRFYSTCAIC